MYKNKWMNKKSITDRQQYKRQIHTDRQIYQNIR